MAKKPRGRDLQSALTEERRKNRRLRVLLDEMQRHTEQNRRELHLQFTRLAQLQAAVDALTARMDRKTT